MRPRAVVGLFLALAACGARTELAGDTGVGDAGAGDVVAPPSASPPPDCGPRPPPGTERFRVAGVVGRPAIAADGTLFAPFATPAGGRGVVAVDACGRERWRVVAIEPAPRGSVRGGAVRLTDGGDVLLTDLVGDVAARGIWRLDRDGNRRAPYAVEGFLARFVAVPVGQGPLLVTQEGTAPGRLDAYDLEGRRVLREEAWSNVNECAVRGRVVACLDRAFDLARRRLLWSQREEILDGTLRHPLPPAVDGDRIYVAMFGLSSYLLVAREVATGRELWRTALARSTRGQVDLLMGGPVVGRGGTIYVYLNVHRSDGGTGRLMAVRPDGRIAWSFAAAATRTDYQRFATHALGDAGVIYLGVGTRLRAIDEDGRARWEREFREGVNASAPVVSVTGDLAVHTDDDQLVVVATESHGPAATAWPVVNGDLRNANAR